MTRIRTPWGDSQYNKEIAPGIVLHSTASHGGIKLSPELHKKMPAALKIPNSGGWYEEDCETSLVVLSFPQYFKADTIETAHATARNYFWQAYESFTGRELAAGESNGKDSDKFLQRHASDLITVAAWGDWHENVPKGMVGVFAVIGGINRGTGTGRYFLVTADEYSSRNRFGIVIQPEAYCETDQNFLPLAVSNV